MPLIRKCEKCGSLDNRSTWSSADDAAKDDAVVKATSIRKAAGAADFD